MARGTVARAVKFLVIWAGIVAACVYEDKRLPTSKKAGECALGAFCEETATIHLQKLSGEIGVRYTGSAGESASREYIVSVLEKLRDEMTNVNIKEFEIEVQEGTGAFMTQIAGENVLKSYRGVKNVVARLTCGDLCRDAVLLGTHYDSTIGTVGAGDSAVATAAMLEIVKAFTRGDQTLMNYLVLVWNGAEETLFDGAHLFFNAHKYAHNVRALINMDAIGTSGPEILFRTNSDLILSAYAHAPYPHGSSFCNDFFGMGIISSNTDYATYTYLRPELNAADLALYRGAYHYHTLLDAPANVPKGTLHNLGTNVLAVTHSLLTTPYIAPASLKGPSYLYYSFYKLHFFTFSWHSVVLASAFVTVFTILTAILLVRRLRFSYSKSVLLCTLAPFYSILSILFSLFAILAFVFIYRIVFGFRLFYYFPYYVLSIFAFPVVLLGSAIAQILFHIHARMLSPSPKNLFYALKLISRFGSSALFSSLALIFALLHFGAVQFTLPFALFSSLALLYEICVPYASDSLSPHIIASLALPFVVSDISAFSVLLVPISSIAGAALETDALLLFLLTLLLVLPASIFLPSVHSVRLQPRAKLKSCAFLAAVFLVFTLTYMHTKPVFDESHPKKTYVVHRTNLDENVQHIELAFSDYGDRGTIIDDMKTALGLSTVEKVDCKEEGLNCIAFYPFEKLLSVRKMHVDQGSKVHVDISGPEVLNVNVSKFTHYSNTGTSSVDVEITHEGLSNLVIKLEANIRSWTAPDFDKYVKHGIHNVYTYKDVSGHGVSKTQLSFEYESSGVQPAQLHVSALVDRSVPKFTFVETPDGTSKAVPVVDSSNAYTELYAKIFSAHPKWTTPFIVFTFTRTFSLPVL